MPSLRMMLKCLLWLYVLLCLDITAAKEKLPISVLMLGWKNPLSLKHTLQTYKKAGFFEMVSEFIIYFQEINEEKIQSVKGYPVSVIGSANNVYIAKAMHMLFASAQYPYVLFVEKDFSIEIDQRLVLPELQKAFDTISNGSAVLYQLRSQVDPGKPLSAKDSYLGREDSAVEQKVIHLCAFSSWIPNTIERWPSVFKTCQPHNVVCVDSAFCNWTNNPFLTTVRFWNEHITPALLELFHKYPLAKHNKDKSVGTLHLLEPFLERETAYWADKHFMVATGKGLFTHYEVDS